MWADEDHLYLLVALFQKEMQKKKEALCQVFLPRAHGARDVHQAEHHRLGLGLGHLFEAVVANIDRVDETDQPPAPRQLLKLRFKLQQAALLIV